MSENSEQEFPEFQYELVRVAPSEAIQKWLTLREEGEGIFSPVILDSPEKYQLDKDGFEALQRDLPGTLASAASISVNDFLSGREREREGDEEFEKESWPAVPCNLEPYLLHHQMEEVFIVKVPTPNPYEAMAYIGFGGWNDCPTDDEHVAIFRYWHERYGAHLFAQGGDTLQCIVERPPTTREEAVILAREQILYAFGTLGEFGRYQTVPELAAALLESKYWIFWWD